MTLYPQLKTCFFLGFRFKTGFSQKNSLLINFSYIEKNIDKDCLVVSEIIFTSLNMIFIVV